MEKEAERALRSSPQHSAEQTLYQLETLEHLHQQYKGKTLRTCLLSYYLHKTRDLRLSILKWLGSNLVLDKYESLYGENDPPEIWHCLAKIPRGKEGFGNKGFVGTNCF